jgi:hypothetical protein
MGSLDTPPPLDSLEPLTFGLFPLFYLDPKFFRCILKGIVVSGIHMNQGKGWKLRLRFPKKNFSRFSIWHGCADDDDEQDKTQDIGKDMAFPSNNERKAERSRAFLTLASCVILWRFLEIGF